METNVSIRDRISRQFSFQRLLRGVFDRPATVVIAVIALTIALGSFIPQLSFNTSIYDLVIEDLPETETYNAFKEQFGCEEIIRVVIKSDNAYDPVTFKKIEEIAVTLARVPGVRRVISLPGVKNAIDISGEWEMAKFQKILAPVDLFRKNLISDDHKTTAISLVLENEADREAVIQAVNAVIAANEGAISLYQIGMPLVSQALAIFTQKDFSRLPPITFLIIALVLLILFRNLPGLILPLVCVSLALVWTFGFMALTRVPISMVTVIVPVFLIAVGAAYCLHVITEYLFYAQGAASPKDALLLTFNRITFPTTLAVFTTVVGLGSLLVNRIPAIREFAVFSCFSILSLLVIVVNFGLMGWLGIELSMATSLIASIAIGLAVDDTIHYMFRYNLEFHKDLDKERALGDTIMHIGRPIVFTTLAISLGFSILAFSSFKPTAVFGLMATHIRRDIYVPGVAREAVPRH